MCHANDLVDQSILENGTLTPAYLFGSVYDAILEISNIVKLNIGNKPLSIRCKLNDFKNLTLKFDK